MSAASGGWYSVKTSPVRTAPRAERYSSGSKQNGIGKEENGQGKRASTLRTNG